MRKSIHLCFISACILLLTSTSSHAVQLRYNVAAGQTYAYDCSVTVEGITGLKIGGQTRNMDTRADGKIGMVMKVREITPRDTALIETLFDVFSLKISTLGQTTYLPQSAGLKGKKIVVEMDRRGKLTKLETPAFKIPDMFLSADSLMEGILSSLPEADIQPEQKWETIKRIPLPQGGSINAVATCTLKGTVNIDGTDYYKIDSIIDIRLNKEKYAVISSTIHDTVSMMPVQIDSTTKVVIKNADPNADGATSTDMDIKTTMTRRK
ncbi:MAG: hypothetical protein PHT33_15865 [bacterium]|nr:hypothetical protein [bacterium]